SKHFGWLKAPPGDGPEGDLTLADAGGGLELAQPTPRRDERPELTGRLTPSGRRLPAAGAGPVEEQGEAQDGALGFPRVGCLELLGDDRGEAQLRREVGLTDLGGDRLPIADERPRAAQLEDRLGAGVGVGREL